MTENAQSSSEDPVAEWHYLSDRAQQIYGGLVGLSDFGHWDSYFSRTFDIYTRLWRFQQQHRSVLESKDAYGLQRWEIGDIASRIGQLYYHYYLRTSDVGYLQEAFLFYDAVRTRSYYKFIGEKVKNSQLGLLVKQLRFYARFIVTCLLLDRRSTVSTLVEEMSHVINEYSLVTRGAGETQEWHLVLQEISLFLQEDLTVNIKSADFKPQPRRTVFPSRPLPPPPASAGPALRLQSCILVGCHQHQVKFSELTLDMYRMMFSLERDPSSIPSSAPSTTSSGGSASSNSGGLTPRSKAKTQNNSNPKKFLLYRPTVSQVLLYIASAQRELVENGTLLLYVSADGEAPKSGFSSGASTPMANTVPPVSPASSLNTSSGSNSIPPSPASFVGLHFSGSVASSTSSLLGYFGNGPSVSEPYSYGGLRLKREDVAAARGSGAPNARNRTGSYSGGSSASTVARASSYVSSSALYPSDVVPFTRRPTFLIVESDNSHAFLSLGSSNGACPFAAPLLVLCSPQDTPTDVLEGSQTGGLFTFYLHDPLAAFLFTSNKTVSALEVYDKALAQVRAITLAIDELFTTSPDLPVTLPQFLGDEFMRMLLVRFCFCYYALKLRNSKELTSDCLPASYPPLSSSLLANANIGAMFRTLAETVGATNLYR